jgi:hypothetical protein
MPTKKLERGVLAPDLDTTAVRANAPVPGYAQKKAPNILATPSDKNS